MPRFVDPSNGNVSFISNEALANPSAFGIDLNNLSAEWIDPQGNVWRSDGTKLYGLTVNQIASLQSLVSGGGIQSLPRWRKKLATDATNCKIVLSGDSTSDFTTTSQWMTKRLQNFHTLPGERLYGVQSSNITALGYNGMALSVWLADAQYIDALVAAAPDLVIASWGINDVRLGLTTLPQMIERLTTFVSSVQARLPNCDIVLRVPNTFTTTNTGGLNYVQSSGGTINPAGAAQSYSTILRSAYMAMVGYSPSVLVSDMQAREFGTIARSTHPLMGDQIHPSTASLVGTTPVNGGYVSIADALAEDIGFAQPGFVVNSTQYRTSITDVIVGDAGNGYIDLASMTSQGTPIAQYPISTSDVVLVNGFAPISLGSASFNRPFGGVNLRVLVTGDYTAAKGYRAVIAGNHAPATTGDRQIVSVDLPSIASGATGTTTAAVTGARTGALHDATAVVCTPPATFVAAGLVLVNCYPSANDTVTLVVLNPTGGSVDLAAANFAFWVVR